MNEREFDAILEERMGWVDEVEVEFDEDNNPVDANNPPDYTYLVPRYRCPDCDKLHNEKEEARDCCCPFYSVTDGMDRD